MKTNTTLFAFLLCAGIIIKFSNLQSRPASTPAGGYSGAPASNLTCANSGCHTGTATEDAAQFVVKMDTSLAGLSDSASIINSTTQFIPGAKYYMSLTLNGSGNRYGFEVSALDNSSFAQAGTFLATNTTNTIVVSGAGTTKCISHKNAVSGTKSWTWTWTAPSTATPVLFNYSGLLAGGNNNETGDNVYYSSTTVQPFVATGIRELSSFNAIGLFPTATLSSFALHIEMNETAATKIQLLDRKGSLVKTLFAGTLKEGKSDQQFDLSDLPAGSYLVNLQTGKGSSCKPIVKL